MNKMNGGYVMVKYDATQSELKTAYETKKPVIMYDADYVGHYAVITLTGTTYAVVKLEPVQKKYRHFCQVNSSDYDYQIIIDNNSNADLTTGDINTFIKSLPADALYPVIMVNKKVGSGTTTTFITAIKNNQSTGYVFKLVAYTFNKAISDSTLNGFSTTVEIGVTGGVSITSQYAIEL